MNYWLIINQLFLYIWHLLKSHPIEKKILYKRYMFIQWALFFYWTSWLIPQSWTPPTSLTQLDWPDWSFVWKETCFSCVFQPQLGSSGSQHLLSPGWSGLDPQLWGVRSVVQFKWKNQPWCCYSPCACCWQWDLSQGRWYTSINTLWSHLSSSVWADGSTQINRRESPLNANVFCPGEICNWNTIMLWTCRLYKSSNMNQKP